MKISYLVMVLFLLLLGSASCSSNARDARVTFILYDAGETKALLPVMDLLDVARVPYNILAAATARELISQKGNPHAKEMVDLNRNCKISAKIDREIWKRRDVLSEADAALIGGCVSPGLIISGLVSTFQQQAVRAIKVASNADAWGYFDGFSAVGIADPTNDFYITPTFANELSRVLVASNSVGEAFRSVVARDKIVVVGQPTVEEWRMAAEGEDRSKVAKELGLDPAKKTILYAGGYGDGYDSAFRAFAAEVSKMREYNIVLSLHPKVDGIAEQAVLKESGADNVKVILGDLRRSMATKRAAVASDLIITWRSSVGTQALFMGKPVIYFDTAIGYSDTAIASGLARQVIAGRGKQTLAQAITRMIGTNGPSADEIYSKMGIPSDSANRISSMIGSVKF